MPTDKQITDFVAQDRGEYINPHVASRRLWDKIGHSNARHLRGGVVPQRYTLRNEGAGVKIAALKYDTVGNMVTLGDDGYIRQYLGA